MRKGCLASGCMLLVTFLAVCVADWVFGLVMGTPPSYFEEQRLQAVAYQQEPYFSREFIRESAVEPGPWITPPGTSLVLPPEFHGKWFNVDHGYRRTLNPSRPGLPVSTVLLLGASSVWGAEVPDDLTVASQLSQVLNERSPDRAWVVINAGVTSVNSRQEVERLRHEFAQGVKPDVVATLNGGNDVTLGIYHGNEKGVTFGPEAVKRRQWLGWLPHRVFEWSRRRAERESIRQEKRQPPAGMNDVAGRAERVRAVAAEYAANLKAMDALCREHGARFVAFLQPALYTSEVTGPDADQARQLSAAAFPALDVAYREGMPALAAVLPPGAVDLRGAFNARKEPIFLDFAHVNSRGNRLLAEAMAPGILEAAPKTRP